MFYKLALTAVLGALFTNAIYAQETAEHRNKKDGGYIFTYVKNLEATEVQNQHRTGTCWSFSALSFIESEVLRMKKGKHNLSEMFIARNAYHEKAVNYVRMHGSFNFGAGGSFHDIPLVISKYGIAPESVYQGRAYGSDKHNHAEMDDILRATVDVVVKNPQGKLTPSWSKAVDGILDAYLGTVPQEFEYEGKKYNPQSFAKSLGLDMSNYLLVTSFTHHPFYQPFVLEIPDNWAFGAMQNVPLDEMIQIIDNALENGYTVAWASDVSEKGFSFADGLAIVPVNEDAIVQHGRDNRHFSDSGANREGSPFDAPSPEKVITQEMRQQAFDNYETTDDHGMHITGIAKDQKGNKYYIVKNSWGTDRNECAGYFYASEAFVRYKTTNIMVHKDAVPKPIAKKMDLK